MIAWLRVSIAGLAVVSTLTCVETANAALLFPELEAIGNGNHAPLRSLSCRAIHWPGPTDIPIAPDGNPHEFVALPLSPLTSTGASSGVSVTPVASALPGDAVRLTGPLRVDTLARERRVRLSVPFLSGVFRPPRVFG